MERGADRIDEALVRTVMNGDSSFSMHQLESVEPLWTLRRDGQSVRAELCRTDRDWEVYLFSDTQWFAAHRLRSHGLALVWADSIYDGLVAEGWVQGRRRLLSCKDADQRGVRHQH